MQLPMVAGVAKLVNQMDQYALGALAEQLNDQTRAYLWQAIEDWYADHEEEDEEED